MPDLTYLYEIYVQIHRLTYRWISNRTSLKVLIQILVRLSWFQIEINFWTSKLRAIVFMISLQLKIVFKSQNEIEMYSIDFFE